MLSASVGFTGSLARQTGAALNATFGFTSTLSRQIGAVINASIGFAGLIQFHPSTWRIHIAAFMNTMNTAMSKQTDRPLQAQSGFAGLLNRRFPVSFNAVMALFNAFWSAVTFRYVRIGRPIRLFGCSPFGPSRIITASNALTLFEQPSFIPMIFAGSVLNVRGSNPNEPALPLYEPNSSTIWSPTGTPDGFNLLGRAAQPGQLLVAPGTGKLSGKTYYAVASGTVSVPQSASGAALNLVLSQNYYFTPSSMHTDTMATLSAPQTIPIGDSSWSLTCRLEGNNKGNGILVGTYTITIGGVSSSGSFASNVNPTSEPIIQLSLGAQFAGTISDPEQFEIDMMQFELQQERL
jgi:hypothetical protein